VLQKNKRYFRLPYEGKIIETTERIGALVDIALKKNPRFDVEVLIYNAGTHLAALDRGDYGSKNIRYLLFSEDRPIATVYFKGPDDMRLPLHTEKQITYWSGTVHTVERIR